MRDGIAWTYRHATLGPFAISTHIWFLANSASATVLTILALRTLGLSPLTFSLSVAGSGVAGLVGASLAPSIDKRLGPGPTIIVTRVVYPVTWLLVAVSLGTPAELPLLFVSLALHGLAAGVENSNEMGYWPALTPDPLLGRVNGTRRSVKPHRRGAPLGAWRRGPRLARGAGHADRRGRRLRRRHACRARLTVAQAGRRLGGRRADRLGGQRSRCSSS
ncbi:hypothetical protein [Tessaracoccus flavescens]|uniref:hypothetical protein n=1 Tax=Tessaracoccus flavescens TaxID=399497 RepID=UPI0012603B65|nr:hypothetical protein [Tessaracoccus flavescens]